MRCRKGGHRVNDLHEATPYVHREDQRGVAVLRRQVHRGVIVI